MDLTTVFLIWECIARPLVGTPAYIGQGLSRLEAEVSAQDNCRMHGHPVCYVTRCEKVTK